MTDRQQTHYAGCWRDPKHHECAVREIEALAPAPMKERIEARELLPGAIEHVRSVNDLHIVIQTLARALRKLGVTRDDLADLRSGHEVRLASDLLKRGLDIEAFRLLKELHSGGVSRDSLAAAAGGAPSKDE